MKLRIEGKETRNYDNPSNERYININSINRNSMTFEEILTRIKLSKNRKIKRKINIKRYKREKLKISIVPRNIIITKTKTYDENELEEDKCIYDYYLSNQNNEIMFNSEEFKLWKEKNNNRFIPPLNAPWQVRKVFRSMEESLTNIEKDRFINIKFELWIYINKTILVQDKMLDIIYGERAHKSYNKFVMENITEILNNLDTIEGYIQLIKLIKEKKEIIYKKDKDDLIEIDLSILSSIENLLRNYAVEKFIDDDLKKLIKKPMSYLGKYRINSFFD